MVLWNLYILQKVQPLWLRKLIANAFGFTLFYPIALHNRETALLLSLFLMAYCYRNLPNQDSQTNTTQADIQVKADNPQCAPNDYALIQFSTSLFCACLFVFTSWQIYVIEALFGCLFLRIYDYYKPSLIGRFYAMRPNRALGVALGGILHGILSGASVILLYYLCLQMTNTANLLPS